MDKKLLLLLLLLLIYCADDASFSGPETVYDLSNITVEQKTPKKTVMQTPDGRTFNQPRFVAYNKYDNNVYLIDSGNHRIVVFDAELNFIKEYRSYGQGEGEFDTPSGIAFLSNGDYIINDYRNRRIQTLDKDFNFKAVFDLAELTPFHYYTRTDSKDRIHANLPEYGHLMSVIDTEGNKITGYGELFDNLPKNLLPMDNEIQFAIDEDNNIYCVFLNYLLIRKYNETGLLICEIQIPGFPAIINRTKVYQKDVRESKSREDYNKSYYIHKNYIRCISVDNIALYIQFYGEDDYPIYVFDKEDFSLLKIVRFQNIEAILPFSDFSSDKYFYMQNTANNSLYKFTK